MSGSQEQHTFRFPRPAISADVAPAIYEAHIGASSGEEGRAGTFADFSQSVLPRIKNLGYNALLVSPPTDTSRSVRLSLLCLV